MSNCTARRSVSSDWAGSACSLPSGVSRSGCVSSPTTRTSAADRARQLGVELEPDLTRLVETVDFITIHLPKTPETIGLFDAELLAHAKPELRIVNTARGGIIDEAALADALATGRIAGAALDVFAVEPTTESPLFALENAVVAPHLGASTAEAQDKAGQTIAEMVVLALRGEFVPFAVNLAASEANATVAPFLPVAERLGRLFTGLAGGIVDTLEVSFEGQIADYDCKVLTLAALKGILGPVVDEPVSFVERAPVGGGPWPDGARDQGRSDPRLREPGRTAGLVPWPRDPCGRDALREAGFAAHRRDRRPHRRCPAVGPHGGGSQRRRSRRHRCGGDHSGRCQDQHRRHGCRSYDLG